MIEEELYYGLFLALYFVTAFFVVLQSLQLETNQPKSILQFRGNTFATILIIFLITLVGLRGNYIGADTRSYYEAWKKKNDFILSSDFLIYFIMVGIKQLKLSYQVFLLVVSFLFYYPIYRVYKKLSQLYRVDFFLALFCFFSFFFFMSTSINVLRQGLSLVTLLGAYALYIDRPINKKKILLLCIIAVSFHLTALIPILIFGLTYFTKKVKLIYFVLFFILGLVLSYLNFGVKGISPFLMDILEGDKRTSYLEDKETHYVIGFKMQFAVFNSLFLMLGLYLNHQLKLWPYNRLLKYYILSSVLFFMAFQIPFSDRWGLFSWFAIPLLLLPIFSYGKKLKISPTIFTFFLIFVFVFFNVLYK